MWQEDNKTKGRRDATSNKKGGKRYDARSDGKSVLFVIFLIVTCHSSIETKEITKTTIANNNKKRV
jgi:hypothetical protein